MFYSQSEWASDGVAPEFAPGRGWVEEAQTAEDLVVLALIEGEVLDIGDQLAFEIGNALGGENNES